MNKQSGETENNIREDRTVRIGLIGAGNRGMKVLSYLLVIDRVEIVAICDEVRFSAEKAAKMCADSGRKMPSVYGGEKDSVSEILDNVNLNAVIITTYWDSHAAIALHAMHNGIYPGIDVPHSHNCIDHWFFDSVTGEPKWQAEYLVKYNRSQYPTHALGPVISWMDINRGDIFTEIYTITSAPVGINTYFREKFGENHPNVKVKYRQGDIVTSLLSTKMGKTLVINNDLQLPRPYANRWMLQGTRGVYDEEKNAIYLADFSPEYQKWEPWQPYEEKYNHRWWQTEFPSPSIGGADFIMLKQFIDAVRKKDSVPLDVYDSAVMSAIVELSGISAEKKMPVPFPDFTRGKWKTNQPYFAG